MSEADIETLRAAFDAASRGDWDVLLRVTHPDFELKTTLVGTHRGHEEVRRFFEDRWEAFEEMVVEPEEFCESFPKFEQALEAAGLSQQDARSDAS